VLDDQIEQVDVLNPQGGFQLWQLLQQEADMVTDLKLLFGRIVEDVECDLVSDAAAGQELIGTDPRQDSIEPLCKGPHHSATLMHRRT